MTAAAVKNADLMEQNFNDIRDQVAKANKPRKTVIDKKKSGNTSANIEQVKSEALDYSQGGFRLTEYVKHYDYVHKPYEDKALK